MKRPGTWDFAGMCAPGGSISRGGYGMFSLGCFQWIPTVDGKRVKRGKVVKRFRGRVDNPAPVYDAARAWCEARNADESAV